jgi:CubicO group peptidase (beta-lactamase class C family)
MRSVWARPAHISATPSGGCLELFVDSTVGKWASKVDMSAAEYQQEYDKQKAAGLQPVRVSAQTTLPGSNRFAAIFASREETDPRVFRAKGPRTVTAIDEAMETYIKDHNLRGAALAITRGTQLVYAKGYTWAEAAPTYPDVLETTLFRQASCSKTFTAVAMWRLMQQRPQDVQLDTRLQSILKLKQPDGSAPKDSRYADIRIQHLLESISGLRQKTTWSWDEATAAFGKPLPATHEQIARYSTSFDLSAAPGTITNVVYGGYDNFMLSQVIAKLTASATFEEALAKLVLAPLKCTRTRGSRSLVDEQAADEARHHLRIRDDDLAPLQLAPSAKSAGKPTVARQYGGWDMELFDGAGGLSSAVVDMARLAAMFSCRSNNPVLSTNSIDALFAAATNATTNYSSPGKKHGFHGFDKAKIIDAGNHLYWANKGGWLPGTGTIISFSTGGFGYVLAQNGNKTPDVKTDWLTPVSQIAQAQTWPSKDLFPNYGMPPLIAGPIKIVAPKEVANLTAASIEDLVRASMTGPEQVPKTVLRIPRQPTGVR